MTVFEAITQGVSTLHEAWSGQYFDAPKNAKLEAQALLAHHAQVNIANLLAHMGDDLSPTVEQAYFQSIARRAQHEPFAYITGHKMFGDLTLTVSPATLIPRPETEELVTRTLQARPQEKRFVDIGTGSGIIAISLATLRPGSLIFATDISPTALAVAKQNALHYQAEHTITFLEGDLLTPLLSRTDWLAITHAPSLTIVSNPPYLTENQWATLDPDVKDYEPKTALVGLDRDGFGHYRQLLQSISAFRSKLPADLFLVVEFDPSQANLFIQTVQHHFPNAQARTEEDLSGRLRFGFAHLAT
jgi:release factor glutamine methyltransferase